MRRDRTVRNSPDGNTRFFLKSRLGAHPRARPGPPAPRPAASVPAFGEADRDTAGTGGDGRPRPDPSPDTVAGHARPANAVPLAGTPGHNTAPASGPAGTAVRTPSTDKAGLSAADRLGLELSEVSEHAGVGPREVSAPERSSRGAKLLTSLRDALLPTRPRRAFLAQRHRARTLPPASGTCHEPGQVSKLFPVPSTPRTPVHR